MKQRDTERQTPTVDLVFDPSCPHVDEARALLHRALIETGLPTQWREWERNAAETPAAFRGFGSPTIVVNGKDVTEDGSPSSDGQDGDCCRVYFRGGELRGVPSLDDVVRALAGSTER